MRLRRQLESGMQIDSNGTGGGAQKPPLSAGRVNADGAGAASALSAPSGTGGGHGNEGAGPDAFASSLRDGAGRPFPDMTP